MTKEPEDAQETAPQKTFGRNLRAMRQARGVSQVQLVDLLAERGLHLHQQSIQKIEKDARPLKFDEAVLIADVLNASLEEMANSARETRLFQELEGVEHQLNLATDALRVAVRDVGDRLKELSEAREALAQSDWRNTLTEAAHDFAEDLLERTGERVDEGVRGRVEEAMGDAGVEEG